MNRDSLAWPLVTFVYFLFVKNAGRSDTELSGVHFVITRDVIDRGKQQQFMQPVINL